MRADDLLVLIEVARCGSFYAAGAALGWSHTTVARRVSALEKEVGTPLVIRSAGGCSLTDAGGALLEHAESIERTLLEAKASLGSDPSSAPLSGLVRIVAPDACSAHLVAPALARLHQQNPELILELVTATRIAAYGTGADIEIGVGYPLSTKTGTELFCTYELGLYASQDYLRAHGRPTTTAELETHSFIYYVDALMPVEELHVVAGFLPSKTVHVGSTNVFAHVSATCAGGGIGLLPSYLARQHAELKPVLPDETTVTLQYLIRLAPVRLRRPSASAVAAKLLAEVQGRETEFRPHRAASTHRTGSVEPEGN